MAGTRITATARSKALAAVAVLALGAGVALLARVDGLGPATGPDRTMRWLGATTTPTSVQVARASEVLAQRPIDGRAYRVLAMAQFAAGESEAGDTLLAIANRRWPRDPLTRAMSAERAFARGDAKTALEHIDAWIRIEPGTRREVLALLMPQL